MDETNEPLRRFHQATAWSCEFPHLCRLWRRFVDVRCNLLWPKIDQETVIRQYTTWMLLMCHSGGIIPQDDCQLFALLLLLYCFNELDGVQCSLRLAASLLGLVEDDGEYLEKLVIYYAFHFSAALLKTSDPISYTTTEAKLFSGPKSEPV